MRKTPIVKLLRGTERFCRSWLWFILEFSSGDIFRRGRPVRSSSAPWRRGTEISDFDHVGGLLSVSEPCRCDRMQIGCRTVGTDFARGKGWGLTLPRLTRFRLMVWMAPPQPHRNAPVWRRQKPANVSKVRLSRHLDNIFTDFPVV